MCRQCVVEGLQAHERLYRPYSRCKPRLRTPTTTTCTRRRRRRHAGRRQRPRGRGGHIVPDAHDAARILPSAHGAPARPRPERGPAGQAPCAPPSCAPPGPSRRPPPGPSPSSNGRSRIHSWSRGVSRLRLVPRQPASAGLSRLEGFGLGFGLGFVADPNLQTRSQERSQRRLGTILRKKTKKGQP